MSISWWIIAGFSVNVFWCVVMIVGQEFDRKFIPLPPRGSLIPGTRQKFMYVQDWNILVMGDFIALSLVNAAFFYVVGAGVITWQQVIVMAIIAIIDYTGFAIMCLGKNHKPDQGFPSIGQISVNGLLHLPYHGINMAIAVMCLYHWLWTGVLRDAPMWFGLTGAVLYGIAFWRDMAAGNFAKLKPEVLPTSGAGCRF